MLENSFFTLFISFFKKGFSSFSLIFPALFYFNICEVQDSNKSSYGSYIAKQVFSHPNSVEISQVIFFSFICGKIA